MDKKQVDIIEEDYYIDLEKMLQINKNETWKQRPIVTKERGKYSITRIRNDRINITSFEI